MREDRSERAFGLVMLALAIIWAGLATVLVCWWR
jgi:hypothetical protein